MGILSEMDMMNRDAEDDAFEVSSDSETVDSFSEEFEPVEPPKPDPQAEDAEEARKKAEFDAAEAKRKAEWEAKQAQKKLREQQELDRLAAMSDDDVMQASMNRVSQDTERLTRRNMKLCVMEDVQTECLADPAFARLVMNPKKKMLNCFHYINRKAREYLEQEMKDNDEKPMGGGFGGDVPDELCYQWAREYFRDAEAKEDAEPEEKFVPKTYNGKVSKAGKGKKDKKKRLCLSILALIMLLFVPVSAYASEIKSDGKTTQAMEEENKTVRVGYFPYANFQEGGYGEHKQGAGYEYLQKISYITGWKYEYVYGSFKECLDMLADGEIDILGSVSYTPERAEAISFSDYAEGTERYWIYTREDHLNLTDGDLKQLNGCRIGVEDGSYQKKFLEKWLDSNQLHAEIVVCKGYDEIIKNSRIFLSAAR